MMANVSSATVPERDNNENFLESQVQRHIATNLNKLDLGPLTLIGTEYQLEKVGRIDVLARRPNGQKVVIEIKRGIATRDAFGQLHSYMGAIQELHPHREGPLGVLVARELDQAAEAALRVTSIVFVSFQLDFLFKKRPSPPSIRSAPVRTDPLVIGKDRRYCVYCKIETLSASSGKYTVCSRCRNEY
jgi:RecB family endonuclease NucS